MNYYIKFLIICALCNSLASINEILFEESRLQWQDRIVYDLLWTFFKTCDLNIRRVILVDDNYTLQTWSVLREVQPQISITLFTNISEWYYAHRYHVDDVQVDAVILIIQPNFASKLRFFFLKWNYNRDCIIYIFPVPIDDCEIDEIFRYTTWAYFSKVYFICLKDNQYTYIITYDPNGDTSPSNWHKIRQELWWGKNWTLYRRGYENDLTELCSGFNFKRTNPSNQSFVILGLQKAQVTVEVEEKMIYRDDIEEFLVSRCQEKVDFLKRLLKLQFHYYVIQSQRNNVPMVQAIQESGVDAMICSNMILAKTNRYSFVHPHAYERIAIISYSQGVMTPLEKIAKFYGIWTLSSLIFMLVITFIVIWFKTRNVSLAVFDVIRLLINSGVFVPIDSRTLKIFFSMIYLYFLVIHATFSGHLAEFLTSVSYRPNIETMQDLEDPKIQKIYNFGYRYHDDEKLTILRQKTEYILDGRGCNKMINKKNSVCIATLLVIERLQNHMNDTNNTFYISKNALGLHLAGATIRRGFPLYGNFNWAAMYLFDTAISTRPTRKERQFYIRRTQKWSILNRKNFRELTPNDIFFAFVFLIIGCCVAFVCFLVEIIFKIMFDKRKN